MTKPHDLHYAARKTCDTADMGTYIRVSAVCQDRPWATAYNTMTHPVFDVASVTDAFEAVYFASRAAVLDDPPQHGELP